MSRVRSKVLSEDDLFDLDWDDRMYINIVRDQEEGCGRFLDWLPQWDRLLSEDYLEWIPDN